MSIKVIVASRRKEKITYILNSLNTDKNFNVITTVRNDKELYQLLKRHSPNLLIISTNLVEISFIKKIMLQKPIPILFINFNNSDSLNKFEVLEFGIVDWIDLKFSPAESNKPNYSITARSHILAKLNINKFKKQIQSKIGNYKRNTDELIEKLGQKKQRINELINYNDDFEYKLNKEQYGSIVNYSGFGRINTIIIIGTSTGGPKLLSDIIPQFPQNSPPILLIQHIPEGFTKAFADRLDRMSPINVKQAEDGDIIIPGMVYLAPGGYHLQVERSSNYSKIHLSDTPPVNFVKPSVDVTLLSAVKIYGSGVISVILTGMGKDGKEGSMAVKKIGGKVIALHESDSAAYGMNKSVIEEGIVDIVLTKDKIVYGIINMIEKKE